MSGTRPTLTSVSSDLLLGGAGDDVRELQLFAFVAPAAVLTVVAGREADRRAIGQRHREHREAGAGAGRAGTCRAGLRERGRGGSGGTALNRDTAQRNLPGGRRDLTGIGRGLGSLEDPAIPAQNGHARTSVARSPPNDFARGTAKTAPELRRRVRFSVRFPEQSRMGWG